MCIIAIKKANQPLPDEKVMQVMFQNNSVTNAGNTLSLVKADCGEQCAGRHK